MKFIKQLQHKSCCFFRVEACNQKRRWFNYFIEGFDQILTYEEKYFSKHNKIYYLFYSVLLIL